MLAGERQIAMQGHVSQQQLQARLAHPIDGLAVQEKLKLAEQSQLDAARVQRTRTMGFDWALLDGHHAACLSSVQLIRLAH